MPVRTFRIWLCNNTEFPLIRITNNDLDGGEWTSGEWEPPKKIPPKTEEGWQSESSGLATGTEGSVKYRIGRPPSVIPGGPPPEPVLTDFVYIYWDNPFAFGTTNAKGSVTISEDGGGDFGEPQSEFELFGTRHINSGAAYNDGLNFIPQLPIAPVILFGTTGITPHAAIRLILRRRGSVRDSFPCGFDGSRGLRAFESASSLISVRSLFRL